MYCINRAFGNAHTLPRRTFFHSLRCFAVSHPNRTPSTPKQPIKKRRADSIRQKKTLWSPEEEALLLKLREDRLSWSEVITHFARSRSALVSKYWAIAPRGEQGRFLHTTRFTDAERALIIELRGRAVEWREIQKRHFPDRHWRALVACYGQTRPFGGGDSWIRRIWSEEESRKLLKLREQSKLDWPELAASFGTSRASVKSKYITLVNKRAKNLGQDDGVGYVSVKSKVYWPEDDEKILVEMIRNGATVKEISEKWPRWGKWGLRVKIADVRRKIGLTGLKKVSPVDRKSLAKIMRLKTKGSTMKEISDLMPEFEPGQLKYAYEMAMKRKREAVAKQERKVLEEKE